MNIANIPAGKYIVAVSGGVDSVVLLHLLLQQKQLELVVAHFDHGMRATSHDDASFVRQLAAKYGLSYLHERVELGAAASEAAARTARYNFLRQAQKQTNAAAIITAHHQDDVLETAIINLWRGTGWRGLCSLRDTSTLRRPLLAVSKSEIAAYASENQLQWREDATNTDTRHLRNAVRHEVLPQAGAQFRQEMLALIARQNEIRSEVSRELRALRQAELSRSALIMLPKLVAKELLSSMVHELTGGRIEQHMLHRMWLFVKTARPAKTLQISHNLAMTVQKSTVVVRRR